MVGVKTEARRGINKASLGLFLPCLTVVSRGSLMPVRHKAWVGGQGWSKERGEDAVTKAGPCDWGDEILNVLLLSS